ncbi:MAG: hypothetical protein ACLRSC_04300, partial [Clostridium perfringens]
ADGNHKVEKEIVVLDGIDKTLLTKAIEEAKSCESLSEIYTIESYEALLEAIKHAEDVLENSSSEKEIGDAIINLRSKISKLEERETVEEDKID